MKLSRKLAVDHYLGGSISWVLNILFQALSHCTTQDHSLRTAPRAILLLKFLGFGSIVRAAFLLPALKQRFPGTKIYFATFPGCAPVVKMYPDIDEVFIVRDTSLVTLALDTFRLLLFAWRHKVDLVVDLEVHSKYSSVVSGLIAARDRAGFGGVTSRFRTGLYTHLVFWNPIRSIDHIYHQLGEALGLRVTNFLYPPTIPDSAYAEAQALLKRCDIRPDSIVFGVNPNASDIRTERRWPVGYFARVINALPETPNLCVLVVGSPSERSYCEELVRQCKVAKVPVHMVAGAVSLAGFAAVIKRFNVLLTNDTGPLHLAAVLDTPTVSLWGPTHPAVYGPQGAKHISFYRPIYCSPCIHASDVPPCGGDNQCLKQLEWIQVHRAVCGALGLTLAVTRGNDVPNDRQFSAGSTIYGNWKRSDLPLPSTLDPEVAAAAANTTTVSCANNYLANAVIQILECFLAGADAV